MEKALSVDNMQLQKITLIGLLLLILIVSVIVGHFLPPAGILAAPIVISLMAGLIIFTNNNLSILIKSLLCYLFIGLNDICIKLFSTAYMTRKDLVG